jgi:hypothetical protein
MDTKTNDTEISVGILSINDLENQDTDGTINSSII